MSIHPCCKALQRCKRWNRAICIIWFPLTNMKLIFWQVGLIHHLKSHVIEAFKSTYTGGTNGNSWRIMSNQFSDGIAPYTDVLSMHLMSFYLFTLYRFEGTSTYMQGKFFTLYSMGINISQHFWGEMKACCRSCHRAFDFRIDSLVGRFITFLTLTIKIWRNRKFTHGVDNFCKRDRGIPLKINSVGGAMNSTTSSFNDDFLTFYF